MRINTLRSIRVVGLTIGFWCVGTDHQVVQAQQEVSSYYTAPGNYGTSYGRAGYGAVRTYSNFSSPGYGRSMRPYAVIQNPWGSGIWNQPNAVGPQPVPYQDPYQTWAVPNRSGQDVTQPLPPIGAYAPTLGPGYGMRRPTAY